MRINKIHVLFVLITLGLIASIIPYMLNLGGENIFIKDFYAKRILAISTLPIIFYMMIVVLKNFIILDKKTYVYLFIWVFYLIYSLLYENNIKYLFIDAFVTLLPLIFISYINLIDLRTNESVLNKFFTFILFFSMLIVSFGIKLQYSYLTLIGIMFLLFYKRISFRNSVFILLLPIIIFQTLIGKNALLMFIFLIFIIFIFEKYFFSFQKKLYAIIAVIFISIFGYILFQEKIQTNHTYRNFVYFLQNTDFSTLEFNDASTGNRIFEAKTVLDDFTKRDLIEQIYGYGFGATIDLSETMDATVINANSDPSKVHHIHIGLFAVLYRYGYLGVFMYLLLTFFIFTKGISLFKKSNKLHIKLAVLYLIIITYDSYVSFPHMMSNYFYWFSLALILRESQDTKCKSYKGHNS